MSKQHFLKGTLILTCAGLLTRLMGFFYRIFLSHTIGAQGLGIYQLLMPLQMLVLAITTSGIQTAISRLAASNLALGKEKEARDSFTAGTAAALFLSVAASVLLYRHAPFFASEILKEPRTMPLIRLLAFSFPLSTLHTCINSFSFAQQKTGIPSFIQLLEQLIRVGATYLLYLIFLSESREITPVIALGGSLAGECAASLASLLCIGRNFQVHHYVPFCIKHPIQNLKKILEQSIPLTVNRVLLTLLGSMEVILIPQRLQLYGHSPQEALAIYGVFTGMALPLILFPSTITNSASVMLMPSIAELQALGHTKRIRRVTSQASRFCLLLGSLCCAFFFLFGPPLGTLLFKSPTAGTYIRTLSFICPFLYLNTTLTSILNGLGKPGTSLLHNVAALCIRITFVLLIIPKLGIRGYLYGILLSECTLTALHLRTLLRP